MRWPKQKKWLTCQLTDGESPFLLFFHDSKILKILQFATCRDSIFSRRFTSQLKISIEIDSTIFPKVENLLWLNCDHNV